MASLAIQPAIGLPTTAHKPHPLLDKKQVGSIRHIGNLARQLKNDWSSMEGPTDLKQDFAAFQFQLAYMSYALALAHFHRLPAAPGVFKNTYERLIEKMLLPEVWYMWRDVSRGGGLFNHEAGITDGWVDPIVKDNIMYSAYVQSMALLYNVLFDDDRYAQPGALTLKQATPMWYPMEGYTFVYDQNSVNERVYWNMVESGYLGVACEPHCVFLACNQPAILGFRFHDMLTGGATADEVTEGFTKAWAEFGGFLDETGSFQTVIQTHLDNKVTAGMDTWSDGWTGCLMHAWNPDFVKENYERQRDRWMVRRQDGLLSINLPEHLAHPDLTAGPLCGMGWLAMLASEVGDAETVEGLLAYADQYMEPEWLRGGYRYPRNDHEYDDEGNLVIMNPAQSNAFFPYARLNVPDGLHLLYSRPWSRGHFAEPALTEVDFSIDIYRAVYDRDADVLLFDAVLSDGQMKKSGEIFVARVLGRSDWTLCRDDTVIARGSKDGMVGEVGERGSVHGEADGLRLRIEHTDLVPYKIIWS
ncbi:MAG TPA: hypothetical protein VJ859_02645 [Allosphingosinicella sp.]|nr:hypothetical protein [Allosphingosinicella sp.]